MKIAVSKFVKRQTAESEYAHFDGSWNSLVDLVAASFDNQVPGYRDGVVLVPVPADRFRTTVVALKESDSIKGRFEARRPGEEPHLKLYVCADPLTEHITGRRQLFNKPVAKRADIVLYRRDVLEENDEQSTDAEWEIVSINASPDDQETPMPPMTRARNILELEGGTSAKLEDKSPEELIALIQEMARDIVYWNQHAVIET